MPSERMTDEAKEKALSAEVIRSQLDDEEVDAFVFIAVEADAAGVLRIIATTHGNRDVLTECLEETLADLRGGMGRPH